MLSSANRTLRLVLDTPRRLGNTIREIVAAPAQFASEKIDTTPGSNRRAVVFYLNLFGVVFVLYTIGAPLYFYTGETESRTMAMLIVQIALAVPAIFLINQALCKNNAPTLSGTFQGVLYVDAVFLLVAAIISVCIGFITQNNSGATGEIDIINTEWENCVTSRSALYWLLRGDLTFLHQPVHTGLAKTLLDVAPYWQYFVILPFCHLFARMMGARYGANYLVNFFGGLAAFVAVVVFTNFVTEKATRRIAHSVGCDVPTMTAALDKYSKPMLTRQLVARINSEMSLWFSSNNFFRVVLEGDALTMKIGYNIGGEKYVDTTKAVQSLMTDIYCDMSTQLAKVQFLELPLELTQQSQIDRIETTIRIEPKQCYEAAGFSLGTGLSNGLPQK